MLRLLCSVRGYPAVPGELPLSTTKQPVASPAINFSRSRRLNGWAVYQRMRNSMTSSWKCRRRITPRRVEFLAKLLAIEASAM